MPRMTAKLRTGPRNKGIKAEKKKQRHLEGLARQKEYDKLSDKEKLQKLDDKLGRGVGALKQRQRLFAKSIVESGY